MSDVKLMDKMMKKRDGTSGISGQLYETKLISLILFRLQHDDSIEEFHLESNMDDVGSFDDICLKLKLTESQDPIYLFIQAKHKDENNTYLKYDLIKHFYSSYVKVKQKFYLSKDDFFNGKFEDTDCLFILYTNAKYYNDTNNNQQDQAWKLYQRSFSNKLNALIATGDADAQAYQTDFTLKDLEFAKEKIKEEEITMLAEHFAMFLNDKSSMNVMADQYVLRYHVILAERVVDISEVKTDDNKSNQWRDLTFKPSFFLSEDDNLKILRKSICTQVFKLQVKNKNSELKYKTSTQPNINSDELAVDKLISSLEQINISQSPVDEAEAMSAARELLLSLKLKVPVTFGNLDLTIGGSIKKIEKRLNTLADFLVNQCKQSQSIDSYKTVILDRTMGDGFLSLKNGIGSAVGNLLVYDNLSKCLKFTDNPTLLLNNATALFDKVNKKITNLNMYRFDVRALITFPKLVFDFTDETQAVLNKIVIYDKQSNQSRVEEVLTKEIEHYQQTHEPLNFPLKCDTIVLHYHNMIQKLWMMPKTRIYFTKTQNMYQETINGIIKEPQISAMQTTFYMNHLNYLAYDFSKTATESFGSLEVKTKIIIVTDIPTLTTIKIIKCYKHNNRYVVLDLGCILNLYIKDYAALAAELKNTENLLIIVCDNIKNNRTAHKRLDDLAEATDNKEIIVITNDEFVETLQEYFPTIQVHNDKNQSLNDFSVKTQKDIIQNTKAIFQGEEINLNFLVNDEFIKVIKGTVLNKIVRNETITIGKSLSNANYEKMKQLYVDRRIRCVSNGFEHDVDNFYAINDNGVIILAEAGMGKSTLLTHLSLKTKETNAELWIVRINLIDRTKEFKNWKDDKAVINTLEAVKFMCQVVLDNNEVPICLKEVNSKVYLEPCTDDKVNNNNEWNEFIISIFLHYLNEKQIIFLFDGYDEICPLYKITVINLIKVIKNCWIKHKIWVTTRPYSQILPDLQEIIDMSYEIDHLNREEQAVFLTNLWKDKIAPDKVSNEQLNIVKALIDNEKVWIFVDVNFTEEYRMLFVHLNQYIRNYFPNESDTDKLGVFTTMTGLKVMGIPFLLYLLGNHIMNIIFNNYNNKNKFAQKSTIFTICEIFIENQVDERFQVKNNMDTSRPDVSTIFNKERIDCINMHKKLAAYAILEEDFFFYDELNYLRPFSKTNSELDTMLDLIKNGKEKTGLISYVTADNIPVFVHRKIAEHFTIDFICDIFKSDKIKFCDKKLLYSQIVSRVNNLNNINYKWIDNKMEIDSDFFQIIQSIRSEVIGFRFNAELSVFFLMAQKINLTLKDLIRIYSSSIADYNDEDIVTFINDKATTLLHLSCNNNDNPLEYVYTLFRVFLIAKMKPHFKKHFLPTNDKPFIFGDKAQ